MTSRTAFTLRAATPLQVKVILLLKTALPLVPIRLNAQERGVGLLFQIVRLLDAESLTYIKPTSLRNPQ